MIEDLVAKQQELMLKVPHTVRPDTLVKMQASVKVIDTLLRYLNSTGHKPWRPIPLPALVQSGLLAELKSDVGALSYTHTTCIGADKDFSSLDHYARQLISAFGIIEETIEYVNSLTGSSSRAHKLMELTDILFFYLEQMILGGFSLAEVEEEYVRKHAINLERYRKGKEGDYSWDERGKGEL